MQGIPKNGPVQLDANDRNAFAGKPISLVAGVEIFKRTDLTLGSILPLSIERNYNGKTSYDSPLGYGWAFTFDKRLYTYPDGSVIVRHGYGKKRKFEHYDLNGTGPLVVILDRPTSSGGGGFMLPIVDNTISLAVNDDGTYTITTKHGDKEYYDTFGRLAKMEDTNGNALIFYYELDVRSPLWGILPANISQTSPLIVAYDYRLSRIEEQDVSGSLTNRYVLFHYEGSTGRLTDIVDSTGRTVSYTHDNLGNLTGVSGPAGSATYGYADANGAHRMTSADEGSGAYVNSYDDKGRVITQTHGNGTIGIYYLTPFMRTSVKATIKDGSGNTLNTNARTVEFDTRGHITKNTDVNGNVTFYSSNIYGDPVAEQHWENTGSTLERRYLTNYSYDDYANLIEKDEAIGTPSARTTAYTYDPVFNFVSTVTTASVVIETQANIVTNSYDDKGNLLSTSEAGLSGDGTPYTYVTAYTYYPNGKLWTIDGPRSDVQDVTTIAYTSQGDIQSITRPLIGTTNYSNHDALGNPQTVNRSERECDNPHL